MVTNCYEPRSILVTGGAGFIASHVAIKLTERYPDVKVGWGACECADFVEICSDALPHDPAHMLAPRCPPHANS